jgi:single-stranded-DNA-specific exonuclease
VKELEDINLERRRIDQLTMDRAVEMVAPAEATRHRHGIVLHDPDWHLGVIGIVASRLVDRFARPVVMLTNGKDDGILKGSGRSVKGFNIYDALHQCDDLLVQYGGHEFAAGLTLEAERFDAFADRFREIAATAIGEEGVVRELLHEGELHLEQVDARFWKLLSQFEPFGPGNDRPVFVSRGVRLTSSPFIVGKGHLKLRLRQGTSNEFEAMGFNMGGRWPNPGVLKSKPLDIAYHIEENHYQGKRVLQMTLLDLRVSTSVD